MPVYPKVPPTNRPCYLAYRRSEEYFEDYDSYLATESDVGDLDVRLPLRYNRHSAVDLVVRTKHLRGTDFEIYTWISTEWGGIIVTRDFALAENVRQTEIQEEILLEPPIGHVAVSEERERSMRHGEVAVPTLV